MTIPRADRPALRVRRHRRQRGPRGSPRLVSRGCSRVGLAGVRRFSSRRRDADAICSASKRASGESAARRPRGCVGPIELAVLRGRIARWERSVGAVQTCESPVKSSARRRGDDWEGLLSRSARRSGRWSDSITVIRLAGAWVHGTRVALRAAELLAEPLAELACGRPDATAITASTGSGTSGQRPCLLLRGLSDPPRTRGRGNIDHRRDSGTEGWLRRVLPLTSRAGRRRLPRPSCQGCGAL